MATEQKEGTGGAPQKHHVPLEETLAKAAARLADTGRGKPVPRRRGGRPAPPPQATAAPEPTPAAPEPATAAPKPATAAPGPATAAREPTVTPGAQPVAGLTTAAPPPRAAAPRTAPPEAPSEPPPRVGRTLLMASAVTLAGLAALFLGLRAYRAPDRTTLPAPPPLPVAAPAPAATPPAPPNPRVEVVQRAPGELSVLIRRAAQNGRAEIIHTVAPGETLWSIAGRYVHDPWAWQQLAAQNGIADANLIRPGDQIRIIFEERKP
jgi:Tfp pilus assembly protein FimV